MKKAAENGVLLDFTFALATKGVILCDNGVMIRIPLRPMDIERNLREMHQQEAAKTAANTQAKTLD